MKRERLLLIDGHGLAYRAFFALPPMVNKRGEPINAIKGYYSMLFKVLSEAPRFDYAIAAFDPEGLTFREKLMDSYKAHRQETPQALVYQIPICQRISAAIGVPFLTVDNYEADDIIGALSLQASQADLDVVILSSDKDLLQLVDDRITVRTAGRDIYGQPEIYTPQAVQYRFGFAPKQMIDYKALAGDSSDNIPGVNGIGDKLAKELIATYGDLDNILANIPRMPAGRARRALEGQDEQARFSRQMVTIARDIPGVQWGTINCRLGRYSTETANQLFIDLGLASLTRALGVAIPPGVADTTKASEQFVTDLDELLRMAD